MKSSTAVCKVAFQPFRHFTSFPRESGNSLESGSKSFKKAYRDHPDDFFEAYKVIRRCKDSMHYTHSSAHPGVLGTFWCCFISHPCFETGSALKQALHTPDSSFFRLTGISATFEQGACK